MVVKAHGSNGMVLCLGDEAKKRLNPVGYNVSDHTKEHFTRFFACLEKFLTENDTLKMLRVTLYICLLRCQFHPTFYKQLFCTKVLCTAFLYAQFVCVFFCKRNLVKKLLVCKILVKLITDPRSTLRWRNSISFFASSRLFARASSCFLTLTRFYA